MVAQEERSHEGCEPIADHVLQGSARDKAHVGLARPQEAHCFAKGGAPGLDQRRLQRTARLPQRERQHECEQEAGGACDDEGGPPPVGIEDETARRQSDERSKRDPHVVEGQRRGSLFERRVVNDQRGCRWCQSSLADTDANPHGQQHDEALRLSAQDREHAPHCHRHADDPRPVACLGQPRDGNAGNGIEQGEREAAHHSDLPIGKVQLVLDRLGQDIDHLPIKEIQDRRNQKDGNREPPIANRLRLCCRGRRRRTEVVRHVLHHGHRCCPAEVKGGGR